MLERLLATAVLAASLPLLAHSTPPQNDPPAETAPPPQDLDTDDWAQIEKHTARLFAGLDTIDRFNGVAVLAVGDRIVHQNAIGWADHDAGEPLEVDTPLRVGGLIQPVTALIALHLAAEGKLDLDAPVSTYVPELATAPAGAATPRQLATGTSGLPLQGCLPESTERARAITVSEFLEALGKEALVAEHGEGKALGKVESILLGIALERASSRALPELVQLYIATPLGLERTYVLDGETDRAPAASHLWQPSQPRNIVDRHPSSLGGAAGLVSTAPEYLCILRALRSGELVPGKDPEAMLTPVSGWLAYGMVAAPSAFRESGHAASVAMHGDSWFGGSSQFVMDLEGDATCVVISNMRDGGEGVAGTVAARGHAAIREAFALLR